MSVPARRMSLGSSEAKRVPQPIYALLFGVEGIGKSTFGAELPKAKLFDLEHRTGHIAVSRMPEPDGGWTWPDVLDGIRLLETETHEYQTAVIDTLDELEALLWKHICDRDKKANIEAYGYGKGYAAALDEWRVFAAAIDRLQAKKKIGVILTAHCVVKTFKNPEGPDYDRYQPKLNDKAAGYLKGKVHDVLFAVHETFSIKEDEKDRKGKGTGTGQRVLHTIRTAGHDGKNSHNLPETMPFNAAGYFKAVQDFYSLSVADVRKLAVEAIAKIKPNLKAEAEAGLARADTDTKLAQLIGWARNNAA